MTTQGYFLYPPQGFSVPTRMSWSMHTVDFCLCKEASERPPAVLRRRGSILATPHQPNALRVTESNSSPLCPRTPPSPPYPPPRRQCRHTLAAGTANLAGKGGAATARGRHSMRKAAAAREGSAVSTRRRPRSTPGARRQARSRGAPRQRWGGGAHEARSGKSASTARGRRRSAQGSQWQPRASGAARHVDGRRRGR